MPLKLFTALIFSLLLASCADESKSASHEIFGEDKGLDLASLVASQTGGARDLASFLDSGREVETINVIDGANYPNDSINITETETKPQGGGNNFNENKFISTVKDSTHLNRKADLKNFEISLEELTILNRRKDQTIASLTRLNEELILEIQRLRSPVRAQSQFKTEKALSIDPDGQLQKLRGEIASLKSNLLQKSQEIEGLRQQNDQFQNGIDLLQPRVNSVQFNRLPNPYISSEVENYPLEYKSITPAPIPDNTANCSLEFDAVVTLLNGKSKEVFYTEFFLVSKSFPDILFDEGIFLKDFPQIGSFEELWAQSRKSPFVFPGIYKRIRNALLNQVEKGTSYRVRTDIDGYAEFKNLNTGSFYLVGTAPVGKTGAVWNVPVRLRSGANKTSLTLANANWSE